MKYLNLDGLLHFIELIKSKIDAGGSIGAQNAAAIAAINAKIPAQASAENQLADKSFVNNSVATNTANFIGTFDSVDALNAYSGTKTNNDYAFVKTTDAARNTLFERYKWNGTTWLYEYALNNSSFTSAQWAALNSGITAAMIPSAAGASNQLADKDFVESLGDTLNTKIVNELNTVKGLKQDKFNDVTSLTNLAEWITNVSEQCENLVVRGVKMSGIIFLQVSYTTKMAQSWHTQDVFTIAKESWLPAVTSLRLTPIAAYYKEAPFLGMLNPIVERSGNGAQVKIGENDAPPGGEVRAVLIYPALNP